MLLIGPLGINLSEISNRNQNIFIQGNASETVFCKMASISSKPQCITKVADEVSRGLFNADHQSDLLVTHVVPRRWGRFPWSAHHIPCVNEIMYNCTGCDLLSHEIGTRVRLPLILLYIYYMFLCLFTLCKHLSP